MVSLRGTPVPIEEEQLLAVTQFPIACGGASTMDF
jgi:hypothetical protein